VSILRLLKSGASTEKLDGALLLHFRKGIAAQGRSPQAIYDRARGQEAAILHQLFKTKGRDALKIDVVKRSSFPREVLPKTTQS